MAATILAFEVARQRRAAPLLELPLPPANQPSSFEPLAVEFPSGCTVSATSVRTAVSDSVDTNPGSSTRRRRNHKRDGQGYEERRSEKASAAASGL